MMALLGLAAHTSFTNTSISTRQLRSCAKQNTLISTSANLLCVCASSRQVLARLLAAKRCWLRGLDLNRRRLESPRPPAHQAGALPEAGRATLKSFEVQPPKTFSK